MNVEQLVEENNRKRDLLSEENEKYYTDLLVYVRLQWRLSEQESEEVLMDMLDHLLEGQKEGKTARDIFGENPFNFADELISEIAHEPSRNRLAFLAGIGISLLAWVLIIRSLIYFVFSFFIEVNTEVNLFHIAVSGLAIALFIFSNIYYILRMIKKDLFKNQESGQLKQLIKAGFVAGSTMAIVLLIIKFTPKYGPSFPFSPIVSLALGTIILVGYFIIKRTIKKPSIS